MKTIKLKALPTDIVYAYVTRTNKGKEEGYTRVEKAIVDNVSVSTGFVIEYWLKTMKGQDYGDSIPEEQIFTSMKDALANLPAFWKTYKGDDYD